MPHKPGHGTQRRRIERQARGQTAQPISRAAQKASRAALVDAESKRLQDFIDDNFNQANKQQASIQMIVEDMPEKFKKRFYDEFGNYIGPQNAAVIGKRLLYAALVSGLSFKNLLSFLW